MTDVTVFTTIFLLHESPSNDYFCEFWPVFVNFRIYFKCSLQLEIFFVHLIIFYFLIHKKIMKISSILKACCFDLFLEFRMILNFPIGKRFCNVKQLHQFLSDIYLEMCPFTSFCTYSVTHTQNLILLSHNNNIYLNFLTLLNFISHQPNFPNHYHLLKMNKPLLNR
jgi:hypothetical protein